MGIRARLFSAARVVESAVAGEPELDVKLRRLSVRLNTPDLDLRHSRARSHLPRCRPGRMQQAMGDIRLGDGGQPRAVAVDGHRPRGEDLAHRPADVIGAVPVVERFRLPHRLDDGCADLQTGRLHQPDRFGLAHRQLPRPAALTYQPMTLTSHSRESSERGSTIPG